MRRLLPLFALPFASLLIACSSKDSADSSSNDAGISNATVAASPTPVRLGVPTGVTYLAATNAAFEALPGATGTTGTLGIAAYRIEMPANWNGELVMFAHGYRGESTQLTVSSPPRALRQLLIDQGFAWAASSYSENGYAPGIGADDTLALKRYFESQYGEAKRTYLYGESMGGNVIALSLEHFADEYDGALAVCGALGGQEEVDYLASWAMLAEATSGMPIPIGEGPAKLNATLLLQLSGTLGSPTAPTTAGKQFLSAIKLLTGGPRPFYLEGFAEQYIANFAYLLVDPARQSAVTRAATNSDEKYTIEPGLGISSADLDAKVRRIPADPAYRSAEAYPDRVPTTAKISDPLLTLHNTGDLFVPISQEVDYLAKAKAAGTSNLLVQRAIRDAGHCKFSEAEATTAWNDLVAWVRDGKRPAGDDLSGDLTDIGKTFTNPLRAGDPGTR